MYKPFLITGRGRSGTKFLATLMNRSRIWTVNHEPRRNHDLERPELFKYSDIFRGAYGEVNSYLRDQIENIQEVKKGIILRNPYQIMLSAINRKSKEEWENTSLEIVKSYIKFDQLLQSEEYYFISFHRMTSDHEYLQGVISDFGIDDVKITEEDAKRTINANKKLIYSDLSECPECESNISRLDFIIDKYNLSGSKGSS